MKFASKNFLAMKKLWVKAIAFCVIASYIFTISFGLSRSYQAIDKNSEAVIQSAIIENNKGEDSKNKIKYFTEAISKLYNTIASVSNIVKL